MTVLELYRILNERIPPALSCPWDNDGLMCCPDGQREVRRVLITLDVTEGAVRKAAEEKYDLILSHHPFIFKGMRSICQGNYLADKAMLLIQNRISVMSFHTRLDAVVGGVNDVLAELLGLESLTAFGNEGEELGRIGDLPHPMTAAEFAERVKTRLGAPCVLLSDAGLSVSRVAVLGGSGKDELGAARAAGADTYVSGELSYHALTDAPEEGMNLIEAGHFFTEQPICGRLGRLLSEIDPTLTFDLYYSNTVRAI